MKISLPSYKNHKPGFMRGKALLDKMPETSRST